MVDNDETSTILKKYVLLPKFIDLMVNFCNKKSDKSNSLTNIERWRLGFASPPPIHKILPAQVFKIHAPGTFSFDVRK